MKKNYFHTLIFIFTFLFFTACGDDNSGKSENSDTEEAATEEVASEEVAEPEPEDEIAICLWGQAGIRSAPGRGSDAKWVAGISLGEIAILTGNTKTVKDKDRERTYLEMTLSDGKTGWSYEYLYAVNGERAVVTKDIDIYKRPELTTFDGEKFERGEVIAYLEGDKEGWYEAFGKEKQKMGWIRSVDGVSTDEVDVTVGILIDKAMAEESPVKQQESLQNIASNNTFKQSQLIDLVEAQLADASEKAEIKDNQLFITGDKVNVRSEPDTEADNVVFQVKSGDICDILEIGEMAEIRDMKDYWYKISFEDQEGWVYGALTSKKQ